MTENLESKDRRPSWGREPGESRWRIYGLHNRHWVIIAGRVNAWRKEILWWWREADGRAFISFLGITVLWLLYARIIIVYVSSPNLAADPRSFASTVLSDYGKSWDARSSDLLAGLAAMLTLVLAVCLTLSQPVNSLRIPQKVSSYLLSATVCTCIATGAYSLHLISTSILRDPGIDIVLGVFIFQLAAIFYVAIGRREVLPELKVERLQRRLLRAQEQLDEALGRYHKAWRRKSCKAIPPKGDSDVQNSAKEDDEQRSPKQNSDNPRADSLLWPWGIPIILSVLTIAIPVMSPDSFDQSYIGPTIINAAVVFIASVAIGIALQLILIPRDRFGRAVKHTYVAGFSALHGMVAGRVALVLWRPIIEDAEIVYQIFFVVIMFIIHSLSFLGVCMYLNRLYNMSLFLTAWEVARVSRIEAHYREKIKELRDSHGPEGGAGILPLRVGL